MRLAAVGAADPFVIYPTRLSGRSEQRGDQRLNPYLEIQGFQESTASNHVAACSMSIGSSGERILRKTAQLARDASGFSESLSAVQSFLADTFGWTIVGCQLFREGRPTPGCAPMFPAADAGANGASERPLILLRVEAGEQLHALLAFRSCSQRVGQEQRAVLEQVANQLSVLAQRYEDLTDPLLHTFEMLKQSQLAGMSEVALSMSHELGQPLAALSAYAGAMQRKLSAERRAGSDIDYLGQCVLEQVERAGEVLQSAKNFLLQQGGARTAVEVERCLEQVMSYVRHASPLRAARIELDIHSGLPLVRGSETQLMHIVMSLLSNAILGSIVGKERVLIHAKQVEHEVRISISSESEQLHAQDDSDMRRLTACRFLAEAQGGRLWSKRTDAEVVQVVALPIIH